MANESLEELTRRFEEMEKRLKVAEDIEQIKQLHGRFMNAHVFGDAEGEAACFTENGILDIPGGQLKGKEAVLKFASGTQPEGEKEVKPVFTEGGFVVHPQIKVDGDKATANWVNYNLFALTRTVQALYWMQAVEDAEYVRENGEWKISYVKWDLRFGLPAEVG